MRGNYKTVYARKTFNISDASTATGMTLRIDYDDGFVAYIKWAGGGKGTYACWNA